MGLVFLAAAIVVEVIGTLSFRAAVGGRKRWYAVFGIATPLSFVFVTLSLREGVPLGAAYGIWAAIGVALIAFFGRVIFKDPLTPLMMIGVALIAGGVLLVNTGAIH